MKISTFVYNSISDAKEVLEDIGFRHIKIVHFNIPRDKLFRYFNNLSGLVELVLRHEIENCYDFVGYMAHQTYIEENPVFFLNKYRSQFIENSKLMKNYYRDKSNLPAKLRNIKKEMELLEKSKKEKFLADLSKKQLPRSKRNEKSNFLSPLFLEMYITKNGIFRRLN